MLRSTPSRATPIFAMKKAVVLGLSLLMALAACRRAKAPLTPGPPEWFEAELHTIATGVAPQAEPVSDTFKALAFKEGDHTDWRIELAAGACYVFVGIGDQTAEELYLNLWDPEDDRVEKKKQSPARVAMEFCAEKPGVHRIQGKVTEGHGHYAVQVFVNPARGNAPPVAAPRPVAKPSPAGKPAPSTPAPANLEGAITALAKSEAAGAEQVGDFFTGSADKTDWYTALDKNKCYWFVGAGDEGVDELHLYLWDPSDKRITANKSTTNRVNVGHCPTVSGMFHFQAKVQAGEGTYEVGVFAKKK